MQFQNNQTDIKQIFAFLDHVEKRNLLPGNTVAGRRVGVKHVLSTLADDEAKTVEYLLENEDSILARFTNKAKLNFKAASLEEYKSRFRNVLADYREWSADPAAWERAVTAKTRASKQEKKEAKAETAVRSSSRKKDQKDEAADAHLGATLVKNSRTVSVPLRGGSFEGACIIPADGLTTAEYQKFGRLLAEYLKDGEARPTRSFAQLEDLSDSDPKHQ